jgi:hypothetical protein
MEKIDFSGDRRPGCRMTCIAACAEIVAEGPATGFSKPFDHVPAVSIVDLPRST